MMIRTILLALLLSSSLAFAKDDPFLADPMTLDEPQPSLGETPTGAILEPQNEPKPVEELAAPETTTPPAYTPPPPVENTKRNSYATLGEDGVYWGMHEGGRKHFQVSWVANGFVNRDFDPTVNEKTFPTMGVKIQYLFYPVVSSFGRVGLGPSGGYYRVSRAETNAGAIQMFAMGAKASYEMQLWDAQLFVPFVEGGFERVNLRKYSYRNVISDTAVVSAPSSTFDSGFYGLGLLIYLNRLEPNSASRALVSSGIKKFYLAYTAEQRDGFNHNLGLRFEF